MGAFGVACGEVGLGDPESSLRLALPAPSNSYA